MVARYPQVLIRRQVRRKVSTLFDFKYAAGTYSLNLGGLNSNYHYTMEVVGVKASFSDALQVNGGLIRRVDVH